MLDNQFDDIIRNKVSEWQHNSLPDWDAFNEFKSKRDDVTDQESFDEIIKQKIQNFYPPASKSNWQTLKNKYNQIQEIKSKVITIKSFELFILLIILIPLSGRISKLSKISDDNNVVLNNNNLIKESANQNSDTKILADLHLNDADEGSRNYNPKQNQKDDKLLNKSNSNFSSDIPETNRYMHGLAGSSSSSSVNTGSPELNSVTEPNSLSESLVNNDQAEMSVLSDKEVINNEQAALLNIQIQKQQLSAVQKVSSLLSYLDLDIRNIAIDFSEFSGSQEVNLNEAISWLSISGSIQNNIINSPVDMVYGIEEHQNYAPGYSLSLKYSRQVGKFEVAGAIAYSKLKYEPYPITENYEGTNGIHSVSLDEISYDEIAIPVEIKYHAFEHPDWSIFIKTGISANLLWKESYIISDELDIPLPAQPGSEIEPNQALLYNKTFSSGLKGDLKFSEALFLTGYAGIGVERKVSGNIRFFMSGYYSQQLTNTLGPNNDKINVAGFETGIKIKI